MLTRACLGMLPEFETVVTRRLENPRKPEIENGISNASLEWKTDIGIGHRILVSAYYLPKYIHSERPGGGWFVSMRNCLSPSSSFRHSADASQPYFYRRSRVYRRLHARSLWPAEPRLPK